MEQASTLDIVAGYRIGDTDALQRAARDGGPDAEVAQCLAVWLSGQESPWELQRAIEKRLPSAGRFRAYYHQMRAELFEISGNLHASLGEIEASRQCAQDANDDANAYVCDGYLSYRCGSLTRSFRAYARARQRYARSHFIDAVSSIGMARVRAIRGELEIARRLVAGAEERLADFEQRVVGRGRSDEASLMRILDLVRYRTRGVASIFDEAVAERTLESVGEVDRLQREHVGACEAICWGAIRVGSSALLEAARRILIERAPQEWICSTLIRIDAEAHVAIGVEYPDLEARLWAAPNRAAALNAVGVLRPERPELAADFDSLVRFCVPRTLREATSDLSQSRLT